MVALLALAALAQQADTPIAVGPWSSIDRAVIHARACGIGVLRKDPLDDEKAMLLVGPSDPAALACIRAWFEVHRREMLLEPAPRTP